ncbi:hypothetical protein C1646_766778 [Rhizophagus diaphanus]|nr:hypothetical protein C1646_766778 [Rhizophagus diaphanus] [Rhizophagus sp. MUCL 43196]
MASTINSILNEFNLVKFKRALDDNTSFSYYRCSAYILNLAAKQELEIVDEEILHVRSVLNGSNQIGFEMNPI